ncbi:MAG: alpha/beta hydrolase [Calditrichia bacterium]
MGGQIVMTLAIQKPEAVNKLILVDPAGIETFTPGEKIGSNKLSPKPVWH